MDIIPRPGMWITKWKEGCVLKIYSSIRANPTSTALVKEGTMSRVSMSYGSEDIWAGLKHSPKPSRDTTSLE